jgi:single-stranded DNA-binding protein
MIGKTMIEGLVSGRLHKKPEQRISQSNGKTFVICSIRTSLSGDEGIFVSVIAFDEDLKRALLALDGGEAISLAGSLKPTIFEGKDGTFKASMSMTANAVLTPYHSKKKREAMQPKADDTPIHVDKQSDKNNETDFPDDEIPL